MGKVDDLRAMREARYAAATRSLKVAAPSVSMRPGRKTALSVVHEVETIELPDPASTEPAALFAVVGSPVAESESSAEPEAELCGHRAISGKTCIRENKHAEKNHKYAKS